MTDTSESNRVPKHKVTSQYAEAQPTFHAVLSRKKKALKCHGAPQSIMPGEQWPFNSALFLKAERHDSVYFF